MYNLTLSLRLLLLFQLLFSLPARAELPQLGDPTQENFSAAEEKQLGLNFYKALRANLEFIDELTVTQYLEDLGQRLVSHSDKPDTEFKFFILKVPNINAFAGPDAYIGIHSGLILAADNEAELAGVLAHEISHVTQRHIARAMTESTTSPAAVFATILAGILIGAQDPDAGAAIIYGGTAAMMQAQINFTRHNEHEADRVGIALLRDTGINPLGMADFFETLLEKAESDNQLAQMEYLRTHPLSSTRIAEAKNRLTADDRKLPSDSLNFQLTKAQILVAISSNPDKVVHNIQAIDESKQNIVTRYTQAIALLANDQAAKAITVLESIIKKNNHPWFQLALAQAHLKNKQTSKAQAVLSNLNALYPNYLPVSIEYARALNQSSQYTKAIELLRQLLQYKKKAVVYQTLAQSYHGNGDTALALEATSYQYELEGYFKLAVQQLDNALKLPNLDTSTQQRIESRKNMLAETLNNKSIN
ncbi:MAG: M48 family metalloprotease [Gammaproteobacteria bacterium]|nr:M48 family metalloprotease [Gammaproteobacteria bacterium]